MSKLREILKRHEGFRSKPYRCSEGRLTVGYGRNLEDSGITESEASQLLDNDIARIMAIENNLFSGFDSLDSVRKDVLRMMIFQMGLQGVMGFKKTLMHIKCRNFEEASREMLDSQWAKQTPSRAYELSQMMRTGLYLTNTKEGDSNV